MFGLGKKKKAKAEETSVAATTAPEDSAVQESQNASKQEQDVSRPGAPSSEDNLVSFEFDRSNGPWDSSEQDTDKGYLDFGSMKVKMSDGLSMRLDVEQKSQQMVAVTLTKGKGNLQVQAFAAPKSSGIWEDISREIADSVRQQGGTVEYSNGPLGRQLISKLPAKTADGRQGFRVARFLGVDGPRWFLRGVLSGEAAVNPESAAEMEEIFRSIVVVRGDDPRPPRDLLPMTVPESVVEAQQNNQQNQQTESAAESSKSRQVPRRGPEITEIG